MKTSDMNNKMETIQQVIDLTKQYSIKTDMMIAEADIKILSEFRDELWEFIAEVKNKWISRWFPENLDEGHQLLKVEYHGLRQKELALAERLLEIQTDLIVLEKMESISLPELSMAPPIRAFSNWNNWSIQYSNKTINKLVSARLPE